MSNLLVPGRTGISFDAVAGAAEAISARGERPTLRAIREMIGSGSFGTIQKHFAQWQTVRTGVSQTPPQLPAEVQRSLLQEIDRQVDTVRRELSEEITALQKDRDALAEENQRFLEEREVAAKELEEGKALISHRDGLVEQLRMELAETRRDLESERKLRIQAEQGEGILKAKIEMLDELKTLQQRVMDLERSKK